MSITFYLVEKNKLQSNIHNMILCLFLKRKEKGRISYRFIYVIYIMHMPIIYPHSKCKCMYKKTPIRSMRFSKDLKKDR